MFISILQIIFNAFEPLGNKSHINQKLSKARHVYNAFTNIRHGYVMAAVAVNPPRRYLFKWGNMFAFKIVKGKNC